MGGGIGNNEVYNAQTTKCKHIDGGKCDRPQSSLGNAGHVHRRFVWTGPLKCFYFGKTGVNLEGG